MAEAFLSLYARERADILRTVAARSGRPAIILEKDIWGVFFHAGYANYDHCLDGRLRLVPDDDQLPGLQADYDAMRAAAIVADDAPEFDALVEEIRTLEANANRPR